MNKEETKFEILSSLVWKLLERLGVQGVQFVVQIILARLLTPEQFGTIAVVMVFINLAQVFVQSGFNTALIQKKEVHDKDFSSILYLSLVIAAMMYIVIFAMAPFIANFYRDEVLITVLRVLSLTLFVGAISSVQYAYISRHLMFKKLFISSMGAIFISGFFGVVAAYSGLAIWALVIQQLLNQLAITIILWFTVDWRPKLVFSFSRVRILFGFGSKLLLSSLLNTFYLELRTLIIGRIYSSSTLGFYNRGEQFPKLIVNNIDGSIQSVMLPSLSKYQDNRKRVKEMMRRAITTSSFIVFPLMVGMAIIAEPLVILVLTERWLAAVPFLQIFCVSYALIPIHTANLQAINSMGRSDIFLKLEVYKKVVGLLILLISVPFGVFAIAIGQIISGIVSTLINASPNKRLLDYGYLEQWKDIGPNLLVSLGMGVLISFFRLFELGSLQLIVVQVIFGAIIYVLLAKIFKIDSLKYLYTTGKQVLSKK